MNLDELKPLWDSYKTQVNDESEWNSDDIARLIRNRPVPISWYQKAQRPFLHFCVSCLLISITSGC